MQKNHRLKLLLNKAKELEKRYDWLGAIPFYEKASSAASRDKDWAKAAELQERIGFCYFRAALQAETNEDFRNRMKLAAEAYERLVELSEKADEEGKGAKINHAKALVAYANSWLATDYQKRKTLLDEWWNLEREALKAYEETGDLQAFGKACNDLLQGSHDNRIWIRTSWHDEGKTRKERLSLGEKAIAALSEVDDDYELARGYCWTGWHYGAADFYGLKVREEVGQKRKGWSYSRKALELSEKTGDANLIGWSNNAASLVANSYHGDANLALEFNEKTRKQSAIAKDNFMRGVGGTWAGILTPPLAIQEEDPNKQRERFEKAVKWTQDSIHYFQIIGQPQPIYISYRINVESLTELALIETNLDAKRSLLKKAIKTGREFLELTKKWAYDEWSSFTAISNALHRLSETETKITEKRRLLEEALEYREKSIPAGQKMAPFLYFLRGRDQNSLALVQAELARIETDKQKKIQLLNNAVSSMENCLKIIAKDEKEHSVGWKSGLYGRFYYWFGEILKQLYAQTKEQKTLERAVEVFAGAAEIFSETDLMSHAAESHWQIAKLHDQLGEHLEAGCSYEAAAEAYKTAAKKIPQLKGFYNDYSLYMQAWSQIEQARQNHQKEDYAQAVEHYEKAADLHKSSEPWSYLVPNYLAWASIEEAENLSRKENTQQAKQTFQEAFEQFSKAEESIKRKIDEITSADETEIALRLSRASRLRGRYCQARILLEEAKLLDRTGKYLQSSKSYCKAAESLGKIIEELESEEEKRELRLIRFLSQAWEKMALAEEHASAKLYVEASQLFEQAKTYSPTKKTTLLILGNSSFCKGLAAGIKYQSSLDLSEHAMGKGHLKSAATSYLQAGFKSASEYAKATQRLFDAYLFMNQAESEVDQEKRAKQYQMAENLLQISAGSFMKAKQPEKSAQVQKILENVREERNLAVSLNEVMHAPAIASTTMAFATPTPTSEVSVGLERFEHANVQANLIAGAKEVKVGESFCLTVEFVNAGREPALLTRVEDFIPADFVVVKKPEIYRLEDSCLNMKGKQLAPLKLVEAKLVLQPSKKGVYHLKPKIHYLDELGQNKSLELKALEIKVEEVVLADRVSTGTQELDSLLLGGIPEEYAVVLTGPPSDEREMIIKNFLEAGTKEDQITFHVNTEAVDLEDLLGKSGFYLFLCNPKPKAQVPDLPNVYKLHGKTDLTNLNIALAKAYRDVDQPSSHKRVCVEIVSDVLLDYGAKTTRKWLSELITDLGSKGFTILTVMNPSMHPPDQATAVLDLFDGEISLYQTEDPLECKKSIRVKKLRNQDYIKNPICLTKQAT